MALMGRASKQRNNKLIVSMGIALISMLMLSGIIVYLVLSYRSKSKDCTGNWVREADVTAQFYEGYGDFFIEEEPSEIIRLKLPVHMTIELQESEDGKAAYSKKQWIDEDEYNSTRSIYMNMCIARIIKDTEEQIANGGMKLSGDTTALEAIEQVLGMSIEEFLIDSYRWGDSSFESLSEVYSGEGAISESDMEREGKLLIIHGESDELYRPEN